ncbi:hypothetical protein N7478_011680 [Penicillium angulare]|uniref:uncharacterized protein n=1 Tax=Penicillium angulare TaxID=116970 RepID=UPI0025402021|nr:uncharacterized protein N7478_011680 [Penicillium angulare]KAJ5261085.1 hypothetical protein N7478_011680 [Penicillium angulare]
MSAMSRRMHIMKWVYQSITLGVCGCYVVRRYGPDFRGAYLPQLALTAHATTISTASRTTLTQSFKNTEHKNLDEVKHSFPLQDGVSVVCFECSTWTRNFQSKVKAKDQANIIYPDHFAENQPAATRDPNSGRNHDGIFLIRIGKVPAHKSITIKITFVGQLK